MGWQFHSTLIVDSEQIHKDHRKFEYLVRDYLRYSFPFENWEITSPTRDNNHDGEYTCVMTGTSCWAEAKYTVHDDQNISSRKFDSTLVSAIIDNGSIIKIFFVTNALINQNLTNRIKKFFYATNTKKISFVYKNNLESWISSNTHIQQKYFQNWNPVIITPEISLRSLQIFHRVDSYTIDSVIENEPFYPLYSLKNYFIDIEIESTGLEEEDISFFCNNVQLYQGNLISGIHSFSLLSVLEKDLKQNLDVYSFEFWYIHNGIRKNLDSQSISFSVPPKIFKPQLRCYRQILSGINNNAQIIYNIYGSYSTGKSWILTKIKDDLLRDGKRKVIYINFCGNKSDLGDICRILFTLIFDYYNLSISAKSLQMYIKNSDYEFSVYSNESIQSLLKALQKNDFDKIEEVLQGANNDGNLIFEAPDCFAWEKIYLIDNVHLLSVNGKSIFEGILKKFKPYNNNTFILTNREEMPYNQCRNLLLQVIKDEEILACIMPLMRCL